jgi:hypothetical protein
VSCHRWGFKFRGDIQIIVSVPSVRELSEDAPEVSPRAELR